MYVETGSDTERSLCIEKVLEDIPGGGIVDPDDFKSDTETMEEGALLGIDSDGIYHLFKTAKVVAGGSSNAPRIETNHELKVGDVLSDGIVALEIDAITEGSTYDTLGFDSGSLSLYSAGTILYVVETVDEDGGGAASVATVEDTSGDYLEVKFPVTSKPQAYNGIDLVIEQAGDDTLAVAYADGTLTISLADSTAANNNVADIQAAIRALETTEGVDFSEVVCTGTDWDDKQTGGTLTTATDVFKGGIDYTRKAPYYSPIAIALNSVDLTVDNQGCGLMVRGSVRENLLPYYVDSDIKALLPFIAFNS